MKRLIFGLFLLVAVTSANVIKTEFNELQSSGPVHIMPLSLNAEPLDFDVIQERYKSLRHNIVKRSPGWKSKGSKSKGGSSSGFFSSKAKGGNKGSDHNSGYNSNTHNSNKHQQHASAPSQPAYNPNYGHPAGPPAHGYGQPAHNPAYGHPAPAYGHPAPAYGHPAPAYGHPAPAYGAPAYHPPAAQQPTVVVVGGGGSSGGYQPAMKGPGLGTALATGVASGVGSGVGFGLANAAINGITGGGNRHPAYPESRPPPQSDNSGNSNNNNNNNNNNNQNNDNFNQQANPECLKTCFSTEEYAPVCGTDGWEYTNIGKLNCMKTCGKRVEIARYGNCYAPPPPGYGVQGVAPVGGVAQPAAVPAAGNVAPATGDVPAPPPNSPVDTPAAPLAPVAAANGTLPAGVEGASGLILGTEPTSTVVPTSTTTVSPEYTECFQKCNATSEFNPQCGTDGTEYSNPSRVECAKGCGRAVDIAFAGTCSVTTTLKP